MSEKSEYSINSKLISVRDLLHPGLWAETSKHGFDYDSEIMVDSENRALEVKVYRFSTKKWRRFTITKGDIEKDVYRAEFRPNLIKVFEELKNES